ncbi:putative aldouronate transport system permease protein [Anaerotaenia torta]|uniref:ABC transporter permease n=1 Tax=Anaerotaenia torta TaxID=433293 RepID=UPI003D1C4D87
MNVIARNELKDQRKQMRLQNRRRLRNEIWRYRKLYPLMLFGVLFFAVFSYAPMYGIQLAFKHYKIGQGITGSEWVGFKNFTILFARAEFWDSIRNTLVISFLKLLIAFPVPILLAIGLNEILSSKLKRSLQVIFTLPHFLSWVTIGGIMLALFATEGAVNGMLEALGGPQIKWLSNGMVFRGLIIFTSIWKDAGWSCIIYMASITGIDPALYESARIDGANRLQCAAYITWPSIKGTAAILLIMQVGHAMNGNFDQIFNMYNPTVYNVADVIDTYIYRISFLQAADYGLSTAVGLFKGITNCILLLTTNYIVGRFNKEAKMI